MAKKPKFTLPGTYINEKRPDREFSVDPSLVGPPASRKPILRMSWDFPQPKMHLTAATVAQTINHSSMPNAVFYPDTCFLTSPMDPSIWHALLTRRICITPAVLQELEAFLRTPYCNGFVHDDLRSCISRSHERISILTTANVLAIPGYAYYAELLALRKLKGMQFGFEFVKRQHREPTKEEFHSQFKQIAGGFDDRAVKVAWKGWVDRGKSNYLADEHTIVTATLLALSSGNETAILTRDHDLQEQFYKLIFLIDTHYRSMLFADDLAASPGKWFSQPIKETPEYLQRYLEERFVIENGDLVAPVLPEPEAWNVFLPEEYESVMIECWWFGDGPADVQLCRMPFCADRQMHSVAQLKERSSGMNSTHFDNRNCHIWPCPGVKIARPTVAIAEDRNSMVSGRNMRKTDMLHSVASHEGYAKAWTTDS